MSTLPKILPPSDCLLCQHRLSGMFCNFSARNLADFNALGRLFSFPAGAILMREEDPVNQVYVICRGQVKLSCVSREGRTLNLKIALSGDVLGLSAVLSGSPYEVTAETMAPTEVNIIPREDFLAFIKSHGEASLHAAHSLAAEYKSALSDARSLALSTSSYLKSWRTSLCRPLISTRASQSNPAILMPPEVGVLMPLTLVLSIGLDSSLLGTRNMVLHSAGYIVESASSVKAAVHCFLGGDFDLVILCHTIPTRERDRLACLIRASGSHTPIISIAENPDQCDVFANATIENDPNKLLPGIRDVLIKEAKKWTTSPRGKQKVTDPSRKKSPILSGNFERQKGKVAVTISTALAQAG